GYGEVVRSIDVAADAPDPADAELVVRTDRHEYRARAVVVAERDEVTGWVPPISAALSDRIMVDRLPATAVNEDVLVIGHTDHAVELASALATAGAGVVLAAGGMDPTLLSPA